MSMIAGFIATLLYLGASVMLALRLRRKVAHEPQPPARWPVLTGWALAVLLHGATIYGDAFSPGGIDMGFFNALSLSAWLIALLLWIASLRHPLELLGIILLPFAALALALELSLGGTGTATALPAGLQIHILTSLLAYSLLAIAAIQAILLAIQNKHLHNHHPRGFIRALPPLAMMESLLFQIIGLGFVFLSASLASGFLFLEDLFAQQVAHKTVLSIAAWLLFGTLLFGRWRFGWRGRIAIRWTLGGFGALVLAYFGSKLVLELVLGR
ncbi:cytochrome C assembly family protein [Thioalkalivibrio sulfidiphilus]|uniref:Cytochrome c assembly protein n=1 Tax=Thioalkalivibrio sulfidiphilus (strain HL-EbGR7) TaxID=396588 RepID=B8GN73_THISH|nr:cytochrome c biogenesis protein CcsA [Thioalkalivibrio sulfidiphilus]ACL71934.1 cytochrome c assembly protein [Thioalkalivibrio sulfidiphilus HL-EbGr7]